MRIDKFTNKIIGNDVENVLNSEDMQKLPNELTNIASGLENASTTIEAVKFLDEQVQNGVLEKKNGVLFKLGDCTIQCMYNFFADPYIKKLEKINKLNLKSVPSMLKVVEVDNDSKFILSKISGTKTGDLIPYSQAKYTVPVENKLSAFKDIQEVVKAGFIDNNIAQGKLWFVTPDDKRIVFPSWEAIRPLNKGEGKEILNSIHSMLFND